jgi:hypothetical protein
MKRFKKLEYDLIWTREKAVTFEKDETKLIRKRT